MKHSPQRSSPLAPTIRLPLLIAASRKASSFPDATTRCRGIRCIPHLERHRRGCCPSFAAGQCCARAELGGEMPTLPSDEMEPPRRTTARRHELQLWSTDPESHRNAMRPELVAQRQHPQPEQSVIVNVVICKHHIHSRVSIVLCTGSILASAIYAGN